MKNDGYKSLLVWQKAIELNDAVYNITDAFPRKYQITLGSHIERTVLSIPSNIAEGKARKYTKDFKRFCFVSIGSCAELDTQVIIADRRGYVTRGKPEELAELINHEARMLASLINKI